ncbi:unnamed protein product [Calicophoron daubneyi]|uniref:Phospholipase n=1 Tax=Calicophoron daubneyi TaxID=300641 RepID=A0AAV2U1Z5_CALDB
MHFWDEEVKEQIRWSFLDNLYLRNTPITVHVDRDAEHATSIDDINMIKWILQQNLFPLSETSRYMVSCEHGGQKWTLIKKLEEILNLNDKLRTAMISEQTPRFKNLRQFFDTRLNDFFKSKVEKTLIGNVPSSFDVRQEKNPDERTRLLEKILQWMLEDHVLQRTQAVINFFEISPLSFCSRIGGTKCKEGWIRKVPSGTSLPLCCMTRICQKERWLVLKDSFVVYLERTIQHRDYMADRRLWRICNAFLMDRTFAFKPSVRECPRMFVLKFYNANGTLPILCPSQSILDDWCGAVAEVLSHPSARDYVGTNRFGSFAPPRSNSTVSVFVDGACYMEALAKAVTKAKYEVFITDWCMNPEIYLRRPVRDNSWRLDKLLQKKASEGVRICVLLYNGVEGVVGFLSYKTARYLQSLHPNIHVYLSPMVLQFWSHHEKMVVIDQSVAFMGGIDLCFGRWDNADHRLDDLYKPLVEPLPEHIGTLYRAPPMIERIEEIEEEPQQYLGASVPVVMKPEQKVEHEPKAQDIHPGSTRMLKDLRQLPYMRPQPSEDEYERTSRESQMYQVFGGFTKQLQAIFSKTDESTDKNPLELRTSRLSMDDNLSFLDYQWGAEDTDEEYSNRAFEYDTKYDSYQSNDDDLEDMYLVGDRCTWIGQDYSNLNICDQDGSEHPVKDLVDRNTTPRTPWHDVGCAVTGMVAADLSRHFVQRWNAIRAFSLRNSTGKNLEARRSKPVLIPCKPCSPWTEEGLSEVLLDSRQELACKVQTLRSTSNWSLWITTSTAQKGFRHEFRQWLQGSLESPDKETSVSELGLERSILSAYINSILDAESFILIENQFFISFLLSSDDEVADSLLNNRTDSSSSTFDPNMVQDPYFRLPTASKNGVVKNRIVEALFIRILRAHREGKPFRLYILIPLIPGFTGEYDDPSSASQHKILDFTRKSLFKGEHALIPRLERLIPDTSKYISVCGLRTYDEWPGGVLRSNLVYIHSKVMVVDDKRLIIGSANLNDRSMLGERDSELAVMIESNDKESNQLGYCPLVRRFRRSLMAEHLGVLPSVQRAKIDEWPIELLDDPVSDEFFYGIWRATAQKNRDIFEEVFNAVPSDKLRTFADCKWWRKKTPLCTTDINKSRKLLEQLRGHLVEYPVLYLDDEYLQPPAGTMESIAPSLIWI